MTIRLVTLLLLPSIAHADCGPAQQHFASCQLTGKQTEVFVCYDENAATYSYGPTGQKPQIYLTEKIERLDYRPWSGVTRETAESVTFYNKDHSYTVVGGFERLLPSDDDLDERGEPVARVRHFGWIEVAQGGQAIARLECKPDTVVYAYGSEIYDFKVAAGQVWDEMALEWRPKR